MKRAQFVHTIHREKFSLYVPLKVVSGEWAGHLSTKEQNFMLDVPILA
jgi:hypothetical protein